MKIRHAIRGRAPVRGVTPRRLAAARRALVKERDRFALFARQIASEQGSPEDRIAHFDRLQLASDQRHRYLAAKHWRWGRRMLALQPDDVRNEIVEAWNRSSIPNTAAYFADFIRTKLKGKRLLPPDEHA